MSQNFADRVKLLMEYDTSTTKSENTSNILQKNIVSEQGFVASSLKSGFAGTFDDILRNVKGGLKTTGGKAIKSVDDLVLNMEKGAVSAAMMGQVRRSLLKSGKITKSFRDELIDDLLSTPGALQKGGTNLKELKQSYRNLGYSDEVADAIANRVIKLRKTPGAFGGVKPAPTVATNVKISEKVRRIAEIFYKRGDGWKKFWTYAKRIGIPLAVGIAVWYLVSGESVDKNEVEGGDSTPTGFRDCNSLEFLTQGCKSDKIKQLQTCIGFTGKDVDGIWGPNTQERMRQLGLETGIMVSDIESICNTYNQVKGGSQQSGQQSGQNNVKYFPGEEGPYADYDTQSQQSNKSSGGSSSEGPTAEY